MYKVVERKDRVLYTNGTSDILNNTTFTYQGWMNRAWNFGTEYTFSTTVNDGLSTTRYDYKSIPDNAWHDSYLTNIPTYFNTKTVRTAGNLESTVDYTYNESLNIQIPTQVTTQHKNTATGEQSHLLSESNNYDWAGNLTSVKNAERATKTYKHQYVAGTSLLESSIHPITHNVNQYTDYTRNDERDITRMIIRENNASGTLVHQADYGYDTYGNMTSIKYTEPNRTIVYNVSHSSAYHHRYPTQISVQTTNADGQTATVITKAEYDPSLMQTTSITDGRRLHQAWVILRLRYDGRSLAIGVRRLHRNLCRVTVMISRAMTHIVHDGSVRFRIFNGGHIAIRIIPVVCLVHKRSTCIIFPNDHASNVPLIITGIVGVLIDVMGDGVDT